MTVAEALKTLKAYRQTLNAQQLRTLKGQILAGDITGAMKGLRKLTVPGNTQEHRHGQQKV